MSSDVNTEIKERVVFVVGDEWVLKRDDTFDKCIEFVTEEALTTPVNIDDMFIYRSMIKFLTTEVKWT
jgi:hypothetical protein